MNRRLLAALIFAAIPILACSPRDAATVPLPVQGTTVPATPTPRSPETPAVGTPTFDASRAVSHIRVLAEDIGERVSGTAAEKQAADYIAGELESYGYAVDIEPFEYEGERFGLSYVELPEGELTGYELIGSAAGTVTAPTVYLGLGQKEDYAGKIVAGRIAVVERGVISFNSKYERAKDTGAVGMIVINDAPGALTFANLDTRSTFPVVAVAGSVGDSVRAVARANAEVTLMVSDDDVGNAINVIARARDNGSCRILVGGHHDSVPGAPGANDNASGVSHVLELARVLAADGLDDGLCFATFGAEEHGLFGSANLADEMDTGGTLPEVMLNFDVTGRGSLVEVIGSQDLREGAIAAGQDLEIEVVSSSLPPNSGSDHQSFAGHGIDVLFFTSGEYAEIHTPGDTIDIIQEDEIERIGLVAQAFLVQELERIARG